MNYEDHLAVKLVLFLIIYIASLSNFCVCTELFCLQKYSKFCLSKDLNFQFVLKKMIASQKYLNKTLQNIFYGFIERQQY